LSKDGLNNPFGLPDPIVWIPFAPFEVMFGFFSGELADEPLIELLGLILRPLLFCRIGALGAPGAPFTDGLLVVFASGPLSRM
jgi:hypothetical protein